MDWTEGQRSRLEAAIGYAFREPRWLERALTHSTRRQEAPAREPFDNEKLEFLGDAVLGLLTGEWLFDQFPGWSPGKLSQSKAKLVSAPSLCAAARHLGLGAFLLLGRGEEKTGGRDKQSVLADAFEALLAAIYLDGGLEPARAFVRRTLLEEVLRHESKTLGQPDRKSALQEFLQARGRRPAEYRVATETGPDHQKRFVVEVFIEGRALAACEGSSKKQAEQGAAGRALDLLQGGAASEGNRDA